MYIEYIDVVYIHIQSVLRLINSSDLYLDGPEPDDANFFFDAAGSSGVSGKMMVLEEGSSNEPRALQIDST
jgi:hypothetical protein